jgi:hypothetical protein
VTTKTVGKSNGIADPTRTLPNFERLEPQQYTQEKPCSSPASKGFHLFYVGRDDVHDVLKHVPSRVSVSLYPNMFGFDDEEPNDILMALVKDPSVTVMITLDRSRAARPLEKRRLDSDAAKDPARYTTCFVIGLWATQQINPAKRFVAGNDGGEDSTNASGSSDGRFVVKRKPGGAGDKAQNRTRSVFPDQDTIVRFQRGRITKHMAARAQQTSR